MTANTTAELTSFHDDLTQRLEADEAHSPEVALVRWREQQVGQAPA